MWSSAIRYVEILPFNTNVNMHAYYHSFDVDKKLMRQTAPNKFDLHDGWIRIDTKGIAENHVKLWSMGLQRIGCGIVSKGVGILRYLTISK